MLTEMPLRGVRDRMLMLKALGAAIGLDQEALLLMAEHARPRAFNAGDTLIAEGEPTHDIHVVTAGRVISYCKNRRLAVSERGASAGVLGVLARTNDGVRVVADVDSLTLEIPAEVLLDALEDNFSVLCAALKNLSALMLTARGAFAAPAVMIALDDLEARKRTPVEMLICLAATPPFETCSIDSLAELVRHTRERHFAPGDLLVRRGERGGRWLGIARGRIRCVSDTDSQTLVAPVTLGMLEALAELPSSYEARSETAIVAYEMDTESFLSVAESHFEFAREFVTLWSSQLLESMGTVEIG